MILNSLQTGCSWYLQHLTDTALPGGNLGAAARESEASGTIYPLLTNARNKEMPLKDGPDKNKISPS